MRSAEEYYRKVRRYSAGVMPMARRSARVKLDCEENWQLKAISLRAGRRPRHRKTFALFLLATLRHTGPVHIKLLDTPCLLHIFLLHCAAFVKGFLPRRV